MSNTHLFAVRVDLDKQIIAIFEPQAEGKGRAVQLDYSKTTLKRGLLIAAKTIKDVLSSRQ